MKFTCPCCGYMTYDESPGSYEICAICRWEDDVSQLRFPREIGANKVSLFDAQINFEKFGAKTQADAKKVRKPSPDDIRDNKWRLFDPKIDKIEEPYPGIDYGESYPMNYQDLYYWKK